MKKSKNKKLASTLLAMATLLGTKGTKAAPPLLLQRIADLHRNLKQKKPYQLGLNGSQEVQWVQAFLPVVWL